MDLRARLAAFVRDCVAHGMTPYAERKLLAILDDEADKQTRKYINAWEAGFKEGGRR